MAALIDPYVLSLAEMVNQQIGLDTYVVLAQWQAEEGVSSVNDWPGYNPAGISPGNSQVDALATPGVLSPNGFLVFPTPSAGALAYATLYATDRDYVGVRAAIQTGNPIDELNAIIQSPWDTGHYGGNGYKLYAAYNAVTGGNLPTPANLGTAPDLTSGSTAGNLSTGSIVIPQTDYSVINGSQQTGDILYPRRYRVLVTIPSKGGQIALDVSALQVQFDVNTIINNYPPYSTVTIFNLSTLTEDVVIEAGYQVHIEAGYVGNQYGKIFSGTIVQPVRSRPDNVTEQLVLYCLPGLSAIPSISNFSILRGQSLPQLINRAITTASNTNLQIGYISKALEGKQMPRGDSFLGLTRDYLNQVATSVGAQVYTDSSGNINFFHPSDVTEPGQIIKLDPTSGLIGVPTQNDIYLQFQCLLNPQIEPMTWVQINNTYVQQQEFQVAGQGGSQYGPVGLSSDGLYYVLAVEHQGDTRGQEWYTTCTAIGQAGGTLNPFTLGANIFD